MNAELLAAAREGDHISLRFHVTTNNTVFRFDVSRTVIGAMFPAFSEPREGAYGYACVAAERIFHPRSAHTRTPSRYFAVIDEAEARNSADFFSSLIALKDKYLAETVYCPAEPQSFLDELRRLEGLTHYRRDRPDPELAGMFPTYINRTITAHIHEKSAPESAMQSDLDTWLSMTVRDPDTGQPVLDGNGQTVPGLFAMRELKTEKAVGALSRGIKAEPVIAGAIALAVRGMVDSRPKVKPRIVGMLKQIQTSKPGTGY